MAENANCKALENEKIKRALLLASLSCYHKVIAVMQIDIRFNFCCEKKGTVTAFMDVWSSGRPFTAIVQLQRPKKLKISLSLSVSLVYRTSSSNSRR